MSSEEMRAELEIFVNEGLQQGWRGWPRHDGPGLRRTGRTKGTNRTHGTDQGFRFSERLHRSYGSYQSN
jgi:hypothetical protein